MRIKTTLCNFIELAKMPDTNFNCINLTFNYYFLNGNSRKLHKYYFNEILMNLQQSLILFISFSNNNILFNITNLKGQSLFFLSTGKTKVKGIRKITLTTLKSSISLLSKLIKQSSLHVKIRGVTKFKRITLKLLFKTLNNKVLSFCDLTSFPHNGTKFSKPRRI